MNHTVWRIVVVDGDGDTLNINLYSEKDMQVVLTEIQKIEGGRGNLSNVDRSVYLYFLSNIWQYAKIQQILRYGIV